jgi:hypothetical protein
MKSNQSNTKAATKRRLHGIVSQRRCLAFLQNMWVRDPVRVRADIARHGEEYRRRILKYALFAGCLTGRRIRNTFGDLIDQIEWEESTREICGDAKHVPPPDIEHIKATLSLHKPDVVITFGKVAGDAVASIYRGRLIRAPHPAARHETILLDLHCAALKLSAELALANF